MSSATITYTLAISVPYRLSPEDLEAVHASAEPHDTDGGVRRYLGGFISEAEENLADLLPDGWGVSVREEKP